MPKPSIRLHDEEEILVDLMPSVWWTWPRYLFTLGLWKFWRARHHFVLTNQRVVVAKGIINKTEQSVPLNRIQDAALRRSPLTGGAVVLSSAGGPLGVGVIGPLTRAEATQFADTMTPLIGRTAAASV